MSAAFFSPQTLEFLQLLSANNNRDWFNEHKQSYEDKVRSPALSLIESLAPELALISRHFVASPRKSGGSMMRVYRDTRFAKDKTPYKTNVGIQFRHEQGKDVHAPGFYIHFGIDACFLGVGIWRPDSKALGAIRDAIDQSSACWLAARDNAAFTRNFELAGDSLKNPPRGYNKEHPLLPDLKRKDFIALRNLNHDQLYSDDCHGLILKSFNEGKPLMKFLCDAVNVPF